MNRLIQILLACLLIFGLCQSYNVRVYNLENRALHADESEQSFTFSKLYFNGVYNYSANGPHGPVLYYYPLKLVDKSFADSLDSRLLRRTLLPIWYATSALLLFAMFFCIKNSGTDEKKLWVNSTTFALSASVFATLMLAYSSISQIYSTYFVQEPFFALFALMLCFAGFAFVKKPDFSKAFALGLCAGLLQSAKETSVIVFAAAVGAWFLTSLDFKNLGATFRTIFSKRAIKFALVTLAGFALVYCVFYSSFFANPAGILDGIKSYGHFFEKSTSAAHTKGFGYYFTLLAGIKSEGALFGESAIFLLAVLGTGVAYLKRASFVKFSAVFAWLNVLALSFIGYKTPWLLLAPISALCIPAGYAAAVLIFSVNKRTNKIAVFGVKITVVIALALLFKTQYLQARNAAYKYASDPRNPFLYVHTLKLEERLVKRIYNCAKVKDGQLKVICITQTSPWPLPWQTLKLGSVKFVKSLPQDFKADDFDIVIFDAPFDKILNPKLSDELWINEFFGLRSDALLRVGVKKDLFYESIK